jgi:hypothetical protein
LLELRIHAFGNPGCDVFPRNLQRDRGDVVLGKRRRGVREVLGERPPGDEPDFEGAYQPLQIAGLYAHG